MARLSMLACALVSLAAALALRPAHAGEGVNGDGPDGSPGAQAFQETGNDSYCLTCHGDGGLWTRFDDGRALWLHVDASALRDSAHGLLTCLSCHTDREGCPREAPGVGASSAYPARAAEMCLGCHLAAAEGYATSAHGAPVLSGAPPDEGATCIDCHSEDGSGHSIEPTDGAGQALAPRSVIENCGGCHGEALESYDRTPHSQLVRFGDRERAATCVDCHGDHAVLAVDDPSLPLSPARLAGRCAACHEGAGEGFAGRWLGHAGPEPGSAVLRYAERGVVVFMGVGLGLGLAHVALDFLRSPRRRGGPER